jgi:RNA polymerase sigma-70 factor (ECF subfamily)
MTSDDQVLLARIRSGDLAAFEAVFRAHYAELVRFAQAAVHSLEIAQDLVSDMFTALYERREQWSIRSTIRAYLISATRYRIINYLRNSGREHRRYALLSFEILDDVAERHSPQETELLEQENRQNQLTALQHALAELSPRSRMVVALRWRQQLSFKEIAEVMDTTSAAVQMQLARAMKILRERVPELLR